MKLPRKIGHASAGMASASQVVVVGPSTVVTVGALVTATALIQKMSEEHWFNIWFINWALTQYHPDRLRV